VIFNCAESFFPGQAASLGGDGFRAIAELRLDLRYYPNNRDAKQQQ